MRIALFLVFASAAAAQQNWVAASNENARVLLEIEAKYSPEEASDLGLTGYDEQIWRPSLQQPERVRHDLQQAIGTLTTRLATEGDPRVKEDLEILIDAAQKQIRSSAAYEKKTIPYINAPRAIFSGLHALLGDQVPAERRPAAVVRLKEYTGLAQGYTPMVQIAEQMFRVKAKDPSLIGPPRAEVEKDIADMGVYAQGVQEALEKYKLTGYDEALSRLKLQVAEFKSFAQSEVLPRSRTDFRLPPELYAVNLDNVGVDYTPKELVALAHAQFTEIQKQMNETAKRIARTHGWPDSDYRSVIKRLKRSQLKPEEVMPLYHETLAKIEDAIRANRLVTLPDRPCIVRQATAAETAQQPAPHYEPPPLIGNHGQQGQFVLPKGTTGQNGKALRYDDFTFPAASWTLTAHEARPGHDLQFASMVRLGVSQARAIFAFNSTNVEGWALYAEWFMLPYMPDEGQLISLQFRLLRVARAFLDPELQQGKITREQTLKVLEDDVVASEAFATEEVDRFTFRMPGQAVSYFDGYTRLRQLRADVEKQLGPKFKPEEFHDFILSQGLLPPALLRKAVMTQFVPKHR